MVSLRNNELVLLALRGDLRVGRSRVSRVRLQPGMRVELVAGISLLVTAVEVPEQILAVRALGSAPVALSGPVYSVVADGRVEPGFEPVAEAHLWAAADGWRLRLGDEVEVRTLHAGQTFTAAGLRFEALEVPVGDAATTVTSQPPAGELPLTIVTRFETVHLHRDDNVSAVVSGIPARVLSELASFASPVPWEMVARSIWKDEPDRFVLRRNWDRHLRALRQRLTEAGLRADLVRPDGCGNVELYLLPGDRVVDES